mmetsp:Transcript_35007/g.91641  ORF Transcript_35007/g.91641 Transcript_35007/m.91641 type:complete len:81 (+) Transcript_35007:344-586(+)
MPRVVLEIREGFAVIVARQGQQLVWSCRVGLSWMVAATRGHGGDRKLGQGHPLGVWPSAIFVPAAARTGPMGPGPAQAQG